ncbi:hypothetical protein ACJMK2_025044 [Sinanodonta woodiana]|uniref:Uncharacterized protein n=1 Tax=Sinanodonta woodiana TaxID=1069815 RepID=A0ABD3XFS3_SINWO
MTHLNRGGRNGNARKVPHGPQESHGHKSRLRIYFEVEVKDGVLKAHHERGVQLIDFSANDTAPNLVEVLAALEARGMNTRHISGLQNAGPKKMLYPVDETKPLLETDTIIVKGLHGHVCTAPPIERLVGPKLVEVHFHGLPKRINTCEIERKLHDRFEILSQGAKLGVFWGYSNITSGVRILKITKEDAPRIPPLLCDSV